MRFIDEDIQRMMNVPKDATEAAIAKDAAECKTIAEAGRAKNEAIYDDCARCVVASRDVNTMQATCGADCEQLMEAGGARPDFDRNHGRYTVDLPGGDDSVLVDERTAVLPAGRSTLTTTPRRSALLRERSPRPS